MKVEVRSDHVLLDGYVNAVGRDSKAIRSPQGAFVEQVMPGTFNRALSKGNTVALMLNHKRALGSTADGTLELNEDNIGLRAKAKVTDAAVMEKARNKKLRGWSFGFARPTDEWEERADAPPRRYLKDFDLREVTIVDDTKTPAYIATSIEMRDEEGLIEYRVADDAMEYDIEEQEKKPEERKEPKTNAKTTLAGYRASRLKL